MKRVVNNSQIMRAKVSTFRFSPFIEWHPKNYYYRIYTFNVTSSKAKV